MPELSSHKSATRPTNTTATSPIPPPTPLPAAAFKAVGAESAVLVLNTTSVLLGAGFEAAKPGGTVSMRDDRVAWGVEDASVALGFGEVKGKPNGRDSVGVMVPWGLDEEAVLPVGLGDAAVDVAPEADGEEVAGEEEEDGGGLEHISSKMPPVVP